MSVGSDSGSEALDGYVAVVRRRWLIVLAVIVAAVGATIVVLALQQPLYEATAQVTLNPPDLGQLTNSTDSQPTGNPDRFAQTQALLARDINVASQTLLRAGVRGRTANQLLASSVVSPVQNADLLQFRVKDSDSAIATRLASAYAETYKAFRVQIDASALRQALVEVRKSLATQERGSPLYKALAQKELLLRSSSSVLPSSGLLVRPAANATSVRPRRARTLVLAAIFGVFIGLAAAFVRDRLDSHVYDPDEVGEGLKLPLLGLIPRMRSRHRESRLILHADPLEERVEHFRTLGTRVTRISREIPAHTIMAVSAVENEGRTGTLANLAIALAQEGKRVLLIDFDRRDASIGGLFGLPATPGLTDVLDGRTALSEALTKIPLALGNAGEVKASTHLTGSSGVLHVLPAGSRALTSNDLLKSSDLIDFLGRAKLLAEYVFIDTSPLLRAADGMILAGYVDALFVVAGLGVLTRPMLEEFDGLLKECPAVHLGYIANELRPKHLL